MNNQDIRRGQRLAMFFEMDETVWYGPQAKGAGRPERFYLMISLSSKPSLSYVI